jgi:hypothetical protein
MMAKGKVRGNKPSSLGTRLPEAPPPLSYDEENPKFCLRYLRTGFDVHALSPQRQAAFAKTLQKLAASQWKELITSPYKGQGIELLPVGQIKPSLPARFGGQPKVMVFRYDGKLPMAGVRVRDVYHVLWIEPEFNQLYNHE